ncbi:MAG: ABC transporter ATP-binding protein [Rhizobiaceae bacterium]
MSLQNTAQTTPCIMLENVTKKFPGVIANDSIDLEIMPGEVHVLLGENGAGKSTLIGLLSGLQQPDEGLILIDGSPCSITSPRNALALGIGTVFQHAMLVPTLTVAENLLIGGPWWQRPHIDSLRDEVESISQTLGIDVDLDALAMDLSLGEQQQVEILRALIRKSRVLILDESTSMLAPSGIEELGALMRRLVKEGMAIIFITHKLKEAIAFGDRISVLKLGRKVGEISAERFKSLDEPTLIMEVVELMFGTQHDHDAELTHTPRMVSPDQVPVLKVQNLTLAPTITSPGLAKIEFSMFPGEVLGIAGIDGNGQKQLAEVLAGQTQPDAGGIKLDQTDISNASVSECNKAGLRYLTDDRLGEGTVGEFPVSLNLVLKRIGSPPFWKNQFEMSAEIDQNAAELISKFDVRTPSTQTPIGRLSGGNIQKVLLARELGEGAKVVIFNKPTYGLDVSNTRVTRKRIKEIAETNVGVLLISTELDELLELCDRIAVMDGGRIVDIVANGEHARTDVGRLMIGLAV